MHDGSENTQSILLLQEYHNIVKQKIDEEETQEILYHNKTQQYHNQHKIHQ